MINKFFLTLSLFTILCCLFLISFNILYKDRLLPNTFISGLNVSGLTKKEAKERIKILVPTNKNIILSSNQREYIYNSNYFKFDFDLEDTVNKAYDIGRNGSFISNQKRKFQSLFFPIEVIFTYRFDKSLIDLEISRIVGEERISGKDAKFIIQNGNILVEEDKEGLSVDYDRLKLVLERELPKTKDSLIEIPYYNRIPEITKEDLSLIQSDIANKFYRDVR